MPTDRSATGMANAILAEVAEFGGRVYAHRASANKVLPYCVVRSVSETPLRTSKRRFTTDERAVVSVFAPDAETADILAKKVDDVLTFGSVDIIGLAVIHQVARNDVPEEGNAESGEEIHHRALTYALLVTRESARR